ncbi:hypothetical protein ACIBW9_33850 [Streptomyces sp. NPDC049541]|uniref:hypothetical protein n=1 Tax=Streptomyces sp. NPDC049541 TaxID=3365594 RepID=UPI0037AC6AC7
MARAVRLGRQRQRRLHELVAVSGLIGHLERVHHGNGTHSAGSPPIQEPTAVSSWTDQGAPSDVIRSQPSAAGK